MPKRKYPTKTAVKKALAECVVDANQPGPMSIIAESDISYWIPRAIEALRQNNSNPNMLQLALAVNLLGLAVATIDARDGKS